MEDNRAERRPRISNYLCNERKLRAVDLSVLESLEADEKKLASLTTLFTVTEDQLNDFATQPLKCLDFARFISSSEGKASEPVSFSMPFDVSNHPDSKSPVCVEMTNLFTTDLKNYEDIMNAKRPTNLVVDMLSESVSLADKLALLTDLEQVAIAQRGRDLIWVQTAFSTLHAWSNHVNMENDGKSAIGDMFAGRSGAFHYFLSRVAATESYLGAQFVIALLTCTDASTDMQQVNPFLTTEQTEELLALACLALCHSNRLGHVNRVLSTSRKLGKFLKQFHVMLESKEQNASAKIDVRQRIIQQLEGLTTDLLSKRYYMSQDRTFDPRYLVFEFIWNLMLREAQVEMIDEFMTTLNAGGSLCRQLIMGSGKTTVIAPMLCLMLGDQKHLVVEAVPPPLLEFSRACARSSFSAILQKRVYTFSFDRSSLMTEATLKKLRHARDDAGVVCTTPTAIKALLLRYIENNTNIRNSESNPNLANARRYAKFVANQEKIIEALNIFVQEGILLCDEIDMLLHPLRSELNFPIGEKHPLDFSPARWTYPMDILNTILIGDKVVTHGWTTEQIQKTMPLIRESTRLAEAVQAMTKVIAEGYDLHALQRVPHLILLDREFYEAKLKPVLVELTISWLETQHFDPVILAGVPLKDALLNKHLVPAPAAPEFKRQSSSGSTLGDASGPNAKYYKMLNICHDWLKSFFPHVLTKIDRVTFGIMTPADRKRALEQDPFMPRTRWKLGIPFVSKDVPSRSSEFAHPDVVIALTFLGYRYEGLRYEDFAEIISEVRAQLVKEVGPMKERKANKLYESWIAHAGGKIKGADTDEAKEAEERQKQMDDEEDYGAFEEADDEVVPLHLLKKSDEEQMQKLYELLKGSWLLEDYYLKEIIYPTFMRHQNTKLSASGQEIGGDILFKRRVGFSGTPSSLLPVEMGTTIFQKGSDGLMMMVMTDTKYVSCELQADGWSVDSILRQIASMPYNERFSALLDTGALITGMSNLEVAKFLLAEGLEWADGVVYLDDDDHKMVLVRATGREVLLSQCGIVPTKLFAIYDQIHTTGTDLPFLSTFNARAVQTLGKDMVWRDYVQGAWRMRRLGRGHTIHLLIIPEVYESIQRDLRQAQLADLVVPVETALTVADGTDLKTTATMLAACAAWLTLNAMRSEKIQFQQLLLQNSANVWRKNAFRIMLQSAQRGGGVVVDQNSYVQALDCFNEKIDFSIADTIEDVNNLHVQIQALVKDNSGLIITTEDHKVINKTLELARLTTQDAVDNTTRTVQLEMNIVQEQEQEVEQEQEQEQDKNVEIEKYVDMQYSRDMEEPLNWNFDTVFGAKMIPETSGANLNPEVNPFYQLADFRLIKRNPLEVPDYLALSVNYFNPKWTGERRLKNVVCVLEYMPFAEEALKQQPPTLDELGDAVDAKADAAMYGDDDDNIVPPPAMTRALSSTTTSRLDKVYELFDLFDEGVLSESLIKHLIFVAMDQYISDQTATAIFRAFRDYESNTFTIQSLRTLLLSDAMRPIQRGRHFIALSLAEGETIRRIMHLRGAELRKLGVEFKLRILPLDFAVLDRFCIGGSLEHSLPDLKTDCGYHVDAASECFRFFDGELIYSEKASISYSVPCKPVGNKNDNIGLNMLWRVAVVCVVNGAKHRWRKYSRYAMSFICYINVHK
jgi:hypothetical protein